MNGSTDTDRLYAEAEKMIGQDRMDEAASILARIEVLDKLRQHRNRSRQSLTGIVIALASVLLVSVLMLVTMPRTVTMVSVVTTGARISLPVTAESQVIDGYLAGRMLSIDNAAYVSTTSYATYSNFPGLSEQPFQGDVSFSASDLKVSSLVINTDESAPASLILDLRNSNLSLSAEHAAVAGEIITTGLDSITRHDGTNQKPVLKDSGADEKRTYYFHTDKSGRKPQPDAIKMSREHAATLLIPSISAIAFSREKRPNSGQTESTIIGGSIYLPETDRRIELNKGEYLAMECVECIEVDVNYSGEYLRLEFKGVASSISGGYEQKTNDYMPTLLEYLYQNQKLAMVWTTLLFLCGYIWNMRGWFN